jgi:hypothetical protein
MWQELKGQNCGLHQHFGVIQLIAESAAAGNTDEDQTGNQQLTLD